MEQSSNTSLGSSIGAALVTATLLHPLEYYKSLQQLTYAAQPLKIPDQPKFFFSGLGAVNLSIFAKTSTRFGVFHYCNRVLGASDANNPGLLALSLIAGVVESLVIVPFENVKVNMIESSLYNSLGKGNHFGVPTSKVAAALRSASGPVHSNDIFKAAPPLKNKAPETPKFVSANTLQAVKNVYALKGLYGFFKGTNVTLVRQCTNSIGFFGTYTSLKQLLDPNQTKLEDGLLRFGLNFASSLVIIFLNQPIDVIKTRFQSSVYEGQYKNSLQCAYKIYATEGGFLKLYAGAIPRFVKVSVNGSLMMIFFSYFEKAFGELAK